VMSNTTDPHIVWWCATKHDNDNEWHLPGHGHTPEAALMNSIGVAFVLPGLVELRLVTADALDTIPLNKEHCLSCWLNREQATGRMTEAQSIQIAVDAESNPEKKKEMLADYMRKKSQHN
jgi:hypothetical protein